MVSYLGGDGGHTPPERERRLRPKEEHYLMLNLVVEKGANKDRDRSGSSITRPRTGTPTEFVRQSGLSSCLCSSSP